MITDDIEMHCLYGQGICIKKRCYAYYVDGFDDEPHCRFVDNCTPPVIS